MVYPAAENMTKARDQTGKTQHSLADHAFGASLGHVHADGEDHDHDHDGDGTLIDAGSQELARVELTSIGIDIGSSGTQVAFSRLFMHGPGEPAAMRRKLKARETLYLSPVVLTPFRGPDEIDIERLRGSVARAFEAANLTPDEIETGAIILTGAAAQRANASAIADALAFETGDIVTAAAGDHMEAALAAMGSGAVERSRQEQKRILNVDIGGATTKLALAENGHVVATAAMRIGGRQLVINGANQLTRFDLAADFHAQRCGYHWKIGDTVSPEALAAMAQRMADDLFKALAGGEAPSDIASLFVTTLLASTSCDGIMFSGGVAEYIYKREKRDFGDLGKLLGDAIAARIETGKLPAPFLPAGECIRATVLGCSEYSLQMSGATSCITAPAKLLPRRNLPVLQPPYSFRHAIDPEELAQVIARHREAFGDDDPQREVALAFRWRGEPSHGRIFAFAAALTRALADRIAAGTNMYLLIEGDAALTLGAILKQELGLPNELLVIDSIVLRNFDFVDIGRLRLPSGMVPVTVKTLQFAADGKHPTDNNRDGP
jgi:ethanolamine utilization protein EutA